MQLSKPIDLCCSTRLLRSYCRRQVLLAMLHWQSHPQPWLARPALNPRSGVRNTKSRLYLLW